MPMRKPERAPIHDPQRMHVYKAEWALQDATPDTLGKEITPRQARLLSKHIINHPALDNYPGIEKARKSIAAKISVRTGLTDRLAPHSVAITNLLGTTLYAKGSPLTVGNVTHETAHKILARTSDGNVAHGSEFTALHQDILTHVFNDRRNRLGSLYREHGAE